MTDEENGTPTNGGEAAPAAPAPTEEVTLLRSRLQGLDAKVSSLTGSATQATKERDEAIAKLQAYEAGKVQGDEALRAQLAEKEAEAAKARRETALARIEAKFPETFALFGESAATMAPEVLAASEARLAKGGASDEEAEPPTPGKHNEPSSDSAKGDKKKMTAADAQAALLALPYPN